MSKNNAPPAQTRGAETAPKFPYTTKPGSLRRFLKEVPNRPKPNKIDDDLLRGYGFSGGNDYTIVRVLKAVNLINAQNEPTPVYAEFMHIDTGARALGPEIRRVYAPLFQASHKPWEESNVKLKNLFRIHSGGSDSAVDLQIQTFKALCEYAVFEPVPAGGSGGGSSPQGTAGQRDESSGSSGTSKGQPVVNINLHIHLPENKSRRDYEDIIEDIGKYIFGRTTDRS
ncbi:MAG TPA: DUF5343 domain-containing protein [Bryobacteraceae bacterium]|nr:DUF5343 domain-containing protein [Bryobacteraceae bacterium]